MFHWGCQLLPVQDDGTNTVRSKHYARLSPLHLSQREFRSSTPCVNVGTSTTYKEAMGTVVPTYISDLRIAISYVNSICSHDE